MNYELNDNKMAGGAYIAYIIYYTYIYAYIIGILLCGQKREQF